jgi:hypothetical protein
VETLLQAVLAIRVTVQTETDATKTAESAGTIGDWVAVQANAVVTIKSILYAMTAPLIGFPIGAKNL